MPDRLERLIKMVYKDWKSKLHKEREPHPDEETLACFWGNKLPEEEKEAIMAHLIVCDICAEAFALQLQLKETEAKEVPADLLMRVKDLVKTKAGLPVLEIFLKLKEKALELLDTTGDILLGQELVPAPLLRSRQIKDFKDEVTILKDFKDIRVEVKIEKKGAQAFSVAVTLKEKATCGTIKDLRVTLIKDDLELESFIADSGKVIFEHVLLGKYTIEISTVENKLVSILVDVRI